MIREMSGFKKYMNETSEFQLLTRDEELKLGAAARNGDKAARDKLIQSNLKLVVSVAKNYVNASNLPFEDIVAEGNLGLIVAVNKYNPDLGYRFSTCAVPWIKQAIIKGITDKSKTIRIPPHIYSQIIKMNKAIEQLEKDGYEDPTNEEIAKKMNIAVTKVDELKSWKMQPVSMDTPLGDESEATITDMVADTNAVNPEDYAAANGAKERIAAALAAMPKSRTKDRDIKIVQMRYGLAPFNRIYTLEEVGKELGLSRERVRQVEKKCLDVLKNLLGNEA